MRFILLPLVLILLFFIERAIYKKLWRKALNVSVVFSEKTIREGEGVKVMEKSENRKRLPLSFVSIEWSLERLCNQYKEGDKPFAVSSSFSLPSFSSVKRNKTINGLKRGIYTINNGRITSTDLFSLENYILII